MRLLVLLAVDATVGIAAFVTASTLAATVGPVTQILARFVAVISPSSLASFEALTAVEAGIFLLGNFGAGDKRRDPTTLFAGVGLGLLILFWEPMWTDFTEYAPSCVFGMLWVGIFVVVGRLLVDRLVLRHRKAIDSTGTRIILIGDAVDVQATLRDFHQAYPSSPLPVGHIALRGAGSVPALGTLAELPAVIHRFHINRVVLCGRLDDDSLTEVMWRANAAGCSVVSLSRPFMLNGLEPQVVWYGGVPHIELTRPALRGKHLLVKRAFDLVVASSLLLITMPLLVTIALLVRLGSRGPVIFRQLRVGYGGRHFEMYKFRSMSPDAESRVAELQHQSIYGDPRLFKVTHDPRITPIGVLLRRTSLDELPQLWNVVRGEMSLVGPRPPLVREVAHYEDKQYARFDMKPGVTGPWQVSGRNRITSFDEVVRIESTYMHGWTIWRDIGILLRTIPAVLRMDGAR